MKTFATLFFTFLVCAALAQQKDDILGIWLSENEKSKVKVYKEDGKYYGKIIWLKNDVGPDGKGPKLDVNNPDESKRDRRQVGLTIVRDLEWDENDKEWEDGEIYDPRSGNTYSVFARLESADKLYLKGYIGVSLIGKSTEWMRVK